jgi:hypothetical protein
MNQPFSISWSAMLDRTAAAATERFRLTRSHHLYLWRHRDGLDGPAALRWNTAAEGRPDGYVPVTPEPLTDEIPVSLYPHWLDQRLRGRRTGRQRHEPFPRLAAGHA